MARPGSLFSILVKGGRESVRVIKLGFAQEFLIKTIFSPGNSNLSSRVLFLFPHLQSVNFKFPYLRFANIFITGKFLSKAGNDRSSSRVFQKRENFCMKNV